MESYQDTEIRIHSIASLLIRDRPTRRKYLEDLIQSGWVGALQARLHYDPTKGHWGVYVTHRIRWSMYDCLRKQSPFPFWFFNKYDPHMTELSINVAAPFIDPLTSIILTETLHRIIRLRSRENSSETCWRDHDLDRKNARGICKDCHAIQMRAWRRGYSARREERFLLNPEIYRKFKLNRSNRIIAELSGLKKYHIHDYLFHGKSATREIAQAIALTIEVKFEKLWRSTNKD